MASNNDSLGIGGYDFFYIKGSEEWSFQEVVDESDAIRSFISNVALCDAVPEFQGTKRCQFINYGSTQLVYVLTINEDRRYTLLVSQPSAPKGIGKTEYDNLKMLNKSNPKLVVSPLYYFVDSNNDKRELYVTPYFYQSRCIGVDSTEWGIWVPEPEYHFREFSHLERKVVNTSMVAALVKLYDGKREMGLSGVRLDGGDFMLEKGFENSDINYENILKRIKLIAARSLVEMDFDEYIEQLNRELSGKEPDKQNLMIIGKPLRNPLTEEEISSGIQLGIDWIKEKSHIEK